MTAISDINNDRQSRKSSLDSPHALVPDFVDEQIRAEMAASMQRSEMMTTMDDDHDNPYTSSSESDSEYDDELDESEFQRLTRERGFGLGSWVDQFVGWTVFGVEDDYPTATSSSSPPVESTVSFAAPASGHDEVEDEVETDPIDEELVTPMEKAGDTGGWADARWFLRLAAKAIA